MPSESEHREAHEHHLAVYDGIVETFPDWAVVALFYCAVHMVEVLAAREGLHNREHSERNYWLKKHYGSIWTHYRILQQESLKTRYLENGDFKMTAAHAKKLKARRLDSIAADIEQRLKARGPVWESKPAATAPSR